MTDDVTAPLAAWFEGLSSTGEVDLAGRWTVERSLVYADASQSGTGRGPYREAEHWRWSGTLSSAVPLAGVIFTGGGGQWFWAKSLPPVAGPNLHVSLSGWAPNPRAFTLGGAFHGIYSVGLPVELEGPPEAACAIGAGPVGVGRVHCLAAAGNARVALLVLPGSAVKTGRNRLWHLRPELAECLAEPVRRLLTRRRTGVLRLGA